MAEAMDPARAPSHHYRPEIDGLRALAVLPVLAFHAGFDAFGGGFVGVDVFFVISGYLITGILLKELDAGRFSLLSFYERRARRILPALIAVMLVCLPAAALLLLPRDLEDFTQSLVAVASFSSNILFWLESGYFDRTAELKPLLHTWSLAVEEQFYILFPLLLLALWQAPRVRLLAVLGLAFGVSLGLAEWGARAFPSAAFYLLPTRAWELLLGVFCAIWLHHRGTSFAPGAGVQVLGLAGLALIAAAVLLFDHDTRFPGMPALLPTVGTGLIILCAVPGTLVHALLRQRLLVGIGLISYSAYLWHQPLFAFVRYASPEEPAPLLMGALLLAVLPLAWVSWRFIEHPFRHPGRISARAVLRGGALAGIACLGLGIAGALTDGFRSQVLALRVGPERVPIYEQILEATARPLPQQMVDDGACRFSAPALDAAFEARFAACRAQHGAATVVLGDSHAMNVYNAFARADVLPFVVGVVAPGCRPHERPHERSHGAGSDCPYAAFDSFAAAQGAGIARVIYHQSGAYFLADSTGKVDSDAVFSSGVFTLATDNMDQSAAYLEALAQSSGIDVLWLGPFREYRRRPGSAIFTPAGLTLHPGVRPAFDVLEAALSRRLLAYPGLRYMAFDALYEVPGHVLVEGCFLFRDADHFSPCGEQVIARSPGTRGLLEQGLDPARLAVGQPPASNRINRR